ncbi:MAG TPA: glycerophosphodiester phosphodiesterase [Candidatus Acidoferrales bacterium]|nr:glycerophosphodiester phosphodiesterase [Candidatus Acidoferrales bacterium]
MKRPLIIAHRGAPGRRRENTLAGFRDGVAKGADWVELDLHRTRDGALVVRHDFTLGSKPIADCTLEEARRLARRGGIALPTLEEVLSALPKSVGLNIEIKAPGFGRELAALLAAHRATDRALCTSFHFPTVAALAEVKPRLRTGIVTTSRLLDPVEALRRTGAEVLGQEFHLVDAELVAQVHGGGFRCAAWTVNRKADLERMVALGVDAIITDYPARLARLLSANK